MFHVELTSLGGILGPLKSDLGLFLPFRATYFIRQKHTFRDNFPGLHGPILRLTFSDTFGFFGFYEIFRIFGPFFRFDGSSRPMCAPWRKKNYV